MSLFDFWKKKASTNASSPVQSLDELMGAASSLSKQRRRPERRLSTKPKTRPRSRARIKRKRLRQLAKKARVAERQARR